MTAEPQFKKPDDLLNEPLFGPDKSAVTNSIKQNRFQPALETVKRDGFSPSDLKEIETAADKKTGEITGTQPKPDKPFSVDQSRTALDKTLRHDVKRYGTLFSPAVQASNETLRKVAFTKEIIEDLKRRIIQAKSLAGKTRKSKVVEALLLPFMAIYGILKSHKLKNNLKEIQELYKMANLPNSPFGLPTQLQADKISPQRGSWALLATGTAHTGLYVAGGTAAVAGFGLPLAIGYLVGIIGSIFGYRNAGKTRNELLKLEGMVNLADHHINQIESGCQNLNTAYETSGVNALAELSSGKKNMMN